jgi:hypothetical protein
MAYLISSDREGVWKFSAKELLAQIKTKWPSVICEELLDSGFHSHKLILPINSENVYVNFHNTSDCIGIESGKIENIAVFALWLRSVVASEKKLLLYDDGYNYDIELEPTTSIGDITDAFCE